MKIHKLMPQFYSWNSVNTKCGRSFTGGINRHSGTIFGKGHKVHKDWRLVNCKECLIYRRDRKKRK